MADLLYLSSDLSGDTAHPITGRAGACGPDTAAQAGTFPSDGGNPGTEAEPLNDVISLQFLTATTDSYTAGRFRTATTEQYGANIDADLTAGAPINIRQWPGKASAEIRGETIVGRSWTALALGYTCNIGAGLGVDRGSGAFLAAVSYDWDKAANIEQSRASSLGARNAYLTRAATAVAAVAATGLYHYDNTTGLLTVRLPGDADPRTTGTGGNGVEYVVRNRTGIKYDSPSPTAGVYFEGVTVSGQRWSRWCDATAVAPDGTGINMFYGRNTTFTDVHVEDAGDHAFAFGTHVENENISNFTINGADTGCYYIVFNASGSGNVASGSARNGTIYVHSLLNHSGVTVDRSAGNVVCYVHGPHSLIDWSDLTIIHHIPPSGLPDAASTFASDNGTAPTDPTYAVNYPVRVTDCSVANSSYWFNQTITTYIGFRRTSLNFSQQNALSNGFAIETQSMTGRWELEGCTLVFNFTNTNGASNCGGIRVGVKMVIGVKQCSFYDAAASHANGKTYSFFHFNTVSKTIDQITAAATPVFRTTAAHGLGVGSTVVLSSTDSTPAVDGTYVVASVPSTTTFTVTGAATVTGAGTTGSLVGSGTVYSYGCDYGYAAKDGTTAKYQVTSGDSTLTAGSHQFHDNRYFNCGYQNGAAGAFWSDNTSFDTAAEWLANVDTGAINNAAVSLYADATTLEPTAAAKAVKKSLALHAASGINGNAYDGHYGAWQYGAAGSFRASRSGQRRGRPMMGVR